MRKAIPVAKFIPVLCLALAGLFATVSASAQTSFELIPTAGYTFGSRTNFYDSYGRIDGGLNFGGSMMFNINRNIGIELLYNHMDTRSGLYDYGSGAKLAGSDLTLDYYMLGLIHSFEIPNSTVHPFIGALLGAAVFTPGSYNNPSDTKFAMGLQLGTNIYMTPRVGLRLKAQLLSPVDGGGGEFYVSNYGAGGGVSGYSDIYQFGFNAGLIIGLGRVLPKQVPHRNYGPRPVRRYYRYPPPYYPY